jgi:hypothetical protein
MIAVRAAVDPSVEAAGETSVFRTPRPAIMVPFWSGSLRTRFVLIRQTGRAVDDWDKAASFCGGVSPRHSTL